MPTTTTFWTGICIVVSNLVLRQASKFKPKYSVDRNAHAECHWKYGNKCTLEEIPEIQNDGVVYWISTCHIIELRRQTLLPQCVRIRWSIFFLLLIHKWKATGKHRKKRTIWFSHNFVHFGCNSVFFFSRSFVRSGFNFKTLHVHVAFQVHH